MASLAFITGLSALWLLAAAGAAAIPVAAHLRAARRGPAVRFPGQRFVREAARWAAAARRLRDALLLAARIGLVVCLTLAFSGAVWSSYSVTQRGGAVVAVVDASASMRRVHRARSLHERAIAAAREELVEAHARGASVGAVVAGRTARALLPRPTRDLEALLAALDAVEHSYERADLSAAIDSARRLAPGTDIVVVTDAQASGMPDAQHGAPLRWRVVGQPGGWRNAMVESIEVSPSQPAPGAEVRVRATVWARSAPYAGDGALTLNGRVIHRRPLRLDAGERVLIEHAFAAPPSGAHAVALKIDARDDMPWDDARTAALLVRDAPATELWTAADASSPLSAAFFARAALDPAGDAPTRDRWTDHAQATWLVEAGALTQAELGVLALRLRRGGGVVWALDSPEAARAFAEFLRSHAPEGLELGIEGAAPSEASPVSARAGSPLAGLLDDLAPVVDGFEIAPSVSLRVAAPASALLALDDGAPLVVEAPCFAGRLVVVAADLGQGAGALARSPLFPLLVDALTQRAAHSIAVAEVEPGERASLPRPAQGYSPPLTDSLGRPVRVDPGAATMTMEPVDSPGFVAVRDAAGVEVAAVAVNVAPGESDPTIGTPPADAAGADAAGAPVVERRDTALAPYLLIAALCFALAEAALQMLLLRPARWSRSATLPEAAL